MVTNLNFNLGACGSLYLLQYLVTLLSAQLLGIKQRLTKTIRALKCAGGGGAPTK